MTAEVASRTARVNGRWKMLLVFLICAAPMIAAYVAYYIVKPTSRNNYGTLIDPRNHPIPAMATTTLDGRPQTLDAFKGKWIMLKAGGGACNDACRNQLFEMRQLRLMQGKEMDRIERVWLITDSEPLDTIVIREFDGTHMLRAPQNVVNQWLPADPGTTFEDHIYLIDPLGNLMLSFPKDADRPEARKKMHKDIAKLLKASAIG
ncbi:SCO family protein [Massilia horti]|uniref:Cytochrome C oxidase subunit I n=1 Tax=Massilia horti TaxID=2562153 RepID=A0A4Y9SQ54_9BURK|nr:cytochrome C oxidase subunit I [Massilia horti]TFW28800.1 cytochrome C oxidase subunit I [Massilia horti]